MLFLFHSNHLNVLLSFHCSLWFKCSGNDGKANVFCVCMLRNEQLTLVRSSSVITKQVVALNLDKPQKKIRSPPTNDSS